MDKDIETINQVGFRTRLYHGTEILRKEGYQRVKDGKSLRDCDLILSKDGLKPGDTIYSESLFGWCEMVVKGNEEDGIIADSNPEDEKEGLLAYLEFGEDDRHCWTALGHANKKSL